jgi:predicted metalloprotease with PDZ domain
MRKTMKMLASVALSSALALCAVAANAAPLMTVRIRSGAMSESKGGNVDVTLSIPDVDFPAGAAFLRIGTRVPGMAHAQPVRDMTVTDASGAAQMRGHAGAGGLEWSPARALKGQVTVHYRIPIENVPLLAGGPATQLRIDGDGFSGQGNMLIAIPQITTPYRIAIDWDLAAMGRGATGVSSYGDGNVEIAAGPIARLDSIVLMAGIMQRYVAGPFEAVWTGTPNFDPYPTMRWAAALHRWMAAVWRAQGEPPYRVFLRFDPMNAGTGAALYHSFIATYGKGVTGKNLRPILAHEMTHTFTESDRMQKWYNEGIAVYYGSTLLTPWLAGLTTTDQFLAHLNEVAGTYYTDVKRTLPESQVAPNFWKDTRIRMLPYDRGGMYFATLNAQELQASGGKRLIGNAIRRMNARAQSGQPLSDEVWMGLLREDLGTAGVALHRTMLSGGLLVPPSDAFGPCFRRVVRKIPMFDLGFSMKSLPLFGPKIIQGLRPGSTAAEAGLRDGDQVSYAAALDDVQSKVGETLTLHVTRDGRNFAITYLPRGKRVDAYQWERVPGIPQSECKAPYQRAVLATRDWLKENMGPRT